MIVDTSVMVSMLINEPEARTFVECITRRPSSMSAGSWTELGVVLARKFRDITPDDADTLRDKLRIVLSPVTASQAMLAQRAFRLFGQNSRSPAKLNFGDCFAYALAKELDQPLLFKGRDFSATDVVPALR